MKGGKRMSEEEKQEEKKVESEVTTPAEDDGVKPKAVPSLEERKALAAEEKELLNLEEENKARRQNAGRAEAGSVPAKPKEETDKEYKDRILSGNL